ncbi:MAG: hypothetical protein KDE56_29600 [Anaerolineales bacterium]|nr:hypothetical protein [Anaerolineales bacterium]
MRQERCENCDRPLLITDAVCWHCGHPRQGSAAAATAAVAAESSGLTAVSGYAILTLVIIISLLLVIRSLGQQPLLVVNSNAPRPRGWAVFTDSQHRFTLNLPPDWQLAEPDEAAFTALLAGQEGWETAVSPLDPGTILLLASSPDDTPQLVAVARNVQLHQLSLNQLTDLIAKGGVDIQELEESESFFGMPQINLTFAANGNILCSQQYALQPEDSYLLTICMDSTTFRRSRDTIEAIQGSFQPLKP